jgi:hypothetical protein
LIEARGSFLPQNSYSKNNSLSTSMMLEMLLSRKINEKLLTENLARWLLYQRNEE